MPEGPDHYKSMSELYLHEVEGINYYRQWYRHLWRYETHKNYPRENGVFIMAPHGGSIESGTSELALATAGFTGDFDQHPATTNTYDFFIFEGINSGKQNGRLHVTASHYDEKVATGLVQNSNISLAFHGCTDEQPDESTGEGYNACLIGGMDVTLMKMLEKALKKVHFKAYITSQQTLNGDRSDNIINKNKRGAGAQFELTTSFRKSLYGVNSRNKRRTTTQVKFWLFVNTIRSVIEKYKADVLLNQFETSMTDDK